MITLHVDKVLKSERKRKAKPKPLPVINIPGKSVKPEPTAQKAQPQEASEVVAVLWEQMGQLKKERAKLSTSTAAVVRHVEMHIRRAEGDAVADEFLAGNISSPLIKQHANDIQELTDKAIKLYDKIQHLEKFGTLPQGPVQSFAEPHEADAIKHSIRRLDDLIYKCTSKIEKARSGLKQPKNSERINTWREMRALAEARRNDLKLTLKSIQYGA